FTTFLYGGYVASGGPGPSRLPVPAAPTGLRYLRREGAGAVQTPVRGTVASGARAGWRRAEAGGPCERCDALHVVGETADGPAGGREVSRGPAGARAGAAARGRLPAGAVARRAALAAIDSTNGGHPAPIGDGETRVCHRIAELLGEVGIASELVESAPGRGSL